LKQLVSKRSMSTTKCYYSRIQNYTKDVFTIHIVLGSNQVVLRMSAPL